MECTHYTKMTAVVDVKNLENIKDNGWYLVLADCEGLSPIQIEIIIDYLIVRHDGILRMMTRQDLFGCDTVRIMYSYPGYKMSNPITGKEYALASKNFIDMNRAEITFMKFVNNDIGSLRIITLLISAWETENWFELNCIRFLKKFLY